MTATQVPHLMMDNEGVELEFPIQVSIERVDEIYLDIATIVSKLDVCT